MKIISRLEELFVGILLTILVVFTFVNVVLRYFFDYSILGSVEVSILMFAWIIFIGSSMAISSNSHIRINLLESFFSEKVNRIFSILISIMILLLSLFMCYNGFIFTYKVLGETLGATNIPKALVYSSFPVGFGLMGVHLIHQLITMFKIKEGKK